MVTFGTARLPVAMVLLSAVPCRRTALRVDRRGCRRPKEVEIELGPSRWIGRAREHIYDASVVVNYGVWDAGNWSASFWCAKEGSGTEITDPGVFLKGVLKDWCPARQGWGQPSSGGGPLLPSTVKGQRGVGSSQWHPQCAPCSSHVPRESGGELIGPMRAVAELGVDRGASGVLQVPLRERGQRGEHEGQRPNNSVLVGFIWQPSSAKHLPGCRRSARDQQRSARLGGHGRRDLRFKLAPSTRHEPGS